MEELHRIHKDVPFGWFAMVQDFLAARAATRRARRLDRATWDVCVSAPAGPGDLHNLSGPH